MMTFRIKPTVLGSSDHELLQEVRNDLIDSFDEAREMELEDRFIEELTRDRDRSEGGLGRTLQDKDARRQYFRKLFHLQGESVELQNWAMTSGNKVVILFEGRDAAEKGGVVKQIAHRLNPRVCRLDALSAPSDRERTQ